MGMKLDEMHHAWIGLVCCFLGFFFLSLHMITTALLFFIAGLLLMIDDFYQHLRQEIEPEFRSPVHQLYGLLLRPWRRFRRWISSRR